MGNRDRKSNFCGTTLVAGNSRPLCPVPTHRLPVNAGIASEDTPVSRFPLPSAAHCTESLFAPLSALRNSLWMRFQLYSRVLGFKLCYALYTPNVQPCQGKIFPERTDVRLWCSVKREGIPPPLFVSINIPAQHPGRCR